MECTCKLTGGKFSDCAIHGESAIVQAKALLEGLKLAYQSLGPQQRESVRKAFQGSIAEVRQLS